MRFSILAATLGYGLSMTAVGGTPADPAMRPPVEQLPPPLLHAKEDLHALVARRDMDALLARVRPETKLDFGGGEAPYRFQSAWDSDQESRQRLWSTLEGILALPGVARKGVQRPPLASAR